MKNADCNNFDTFILGKAVTIAVTPTLIATNNGARRRFQPVRRQCYFEDEIMLLHFPHSEGYRYFVIASNFLACFS